MDKNETLVKLIDEEKQFLKDGSELLKEAETVSEQDKEYFATQKKIARVASGYTKTTEMLALFLLQLVQERNKLVFLLFRKEILSDELKKRFLEMTAIEDAIEYYNEEKEKTDAAFEERNKQFAKFKEEQDKMEVFKAILNGMSIEDAEARLAEYNEEMKKAVQGK